MLTAVDVTFEASSKNMRLFCEVARDFQRIEIPDAEVELFLPKDEQCLIPKDPSLSKSTREINHLFSYVGGTFTGELPLSCLGFTKPSLDDIIEIEIDHNLLLSPEACIGVLKRDATRGRAMPDEILRALRSQAKGVVK
ncbi:hypothetical protein [Rhizobium sp. BK176]|uniref:hypothetical protein n=1 Tax=Rhizobium sp. BK176 TaxID=2587071 RepID=UPI0021693AFA|nr:hypothetical protein [Rhizobium sp. BK176]MCS4089291.1 hypothetical protein [Rhizobium sp. BK176]